MLGYGDESAYFTVELTYNYGKKSYKMGNEFGGFTIKSREVVNIIKAGSYPFEEQSNGVVVKDPAGYKFFILNEDASADEDPISNIIYNVKNLDESIKYWHGILNMNILKKDDTSALLSYNGKFGILFNKIEDPINRAEAFGRIAFAVPYDTQPSIDKLIRENNQKILTELVSLDTPGKATVRVIILADPDGHEICFVDDEGFSQLSAFDPKGDADLNKYIKKDPFQDQK